VCATSSLDLVVFNVFTDADLALYQALFRASQRGFVPLVFPPKSAVGHLDGTGPKLELARSWLKSADALVISAGAGLSAASGLDYNDRELFARLFPDAVRWEGMACMYHAIGKRDWSSPAAMWAYLAQQVSMARFEWPASPEVYGRLLNFVSGRDYFVLTSNADGMFEQNGFDPALISTPQGDYSRLQCLSKCQPDAVWPSRDVLANLRGHLVGGGETGPQVVDPSVPLPTCPYCGGAAFLNVRGGSWFLESHLRPTQERLEQWLESQLGAGRRLVILELGAGYNTPGVIRWPSEAWVAKAGVLGRLIRVNPAHSEVPVELGGRALGLDLGARQALAELLS
jgi:NAD-dependent SIR2 family protein deacetylase